MKKDAARLSFPLITARRATLIDANRRKTPKKKKKKKKKRCVNARTHRK